MCIVDTCILIFNVLALFFFSFVSLDADLSSKYVDLIFIYLHYIRIIIHEIHTATVGTVISY